jgi:4'-phosphopantetheinyl transferase
VWRADLTAVTDDLAELLSPGERLRAKRFPSAPNEQRWTRARGLLRALLGRYLDTDPRALRLVQGAHGKPMLLDAVVGVSASGRQLSFNLSHSDGLALYAFTETGPVGVDIEVARRAINEIAIARRTLGQAEAERLETLDPATRTREFLRAWVRHEAKLKCLGTGIGRAAAGTGGREPWIAELEMGAGASGAVALERAPHELCCWDWPQG